MLLVNFVETHRPLLCMFMYQVSSSKSKLSSRDGALQTAHSESELTKAFDVVCHVCLARVFCGLCDVCPPFGFGLFFFSRR